MLMTGEKSGEIFEKNYINEKTVCNKEPGLLINVLE